MDDCRFDSLTRSIGAGSTRRAVLAVLVAALGLAVPCHDRPEAQAAKRKKRNTAKPNAFGCLNVGQKCRGKGSKCCSGICHGKRPKKGEKDKSRCAGHDVGTCQADQQRLECGGAATVPCTNNAGMAGLCAVTTGNAGYCHRDIDCFPCHRDTDCEPVCGEGAACIACAITCAGQGGTACAGIDNCVFPVMG